MKENRFRIVIPGILVLGVLFLGFLFVNNDIGVSATKIEADIRSSQKITVDWNVEGSVSDSMAAFISYPQDKTDHTFSVYVNRPGFSFGYFFRGGGDINAVQKHIAEYVVEGYNDRAFISMNEQKVVRIEIDNGNSIDVKEIDPNNPFAIVLPVNAGTITFIDINGNEVTSYEQKL